MCLKVLFIPDNYVSPDQIPADAPPLPTAAQVSPTAEVVRGFYLRDEGYSETGAVSSILGLT